MSFFNRLFGGKKETNSEDNGIVTVKDLRKGWRFEYDGESWVVAEYSVYTWDNGVKDLEWEVKSDTGRKEYLNYESVGGSMSMYKEANIKAVWKEALRRMTNDSMSEGSFNYNNIKFSYADEGYADVHGTGESYAMNNWLFADSSKSHFVSFNKYENDYSDCYTGIAVADNEIRNIQRKTAS